MIIEQGTTVKLSKAKSHIVRQSSQLNLTKGQESYDSTTQLVKTEGLTNEQIQVVTRLLTEGKLQFNSVLQS
jgi:hypothetical protein